MLTAVRAPAADLAARSALDAAATRIRYLELATGEPTGPGWTSLGGLLAPANRAGLLDVAASHCGGASTPVARTAAGTLFFGDLASALAAPVAVLLTAQRRGVVLDPDGVRVRLGGTGIDGIALTAPRLLALPADPLVGLPGVIGCPDADALHAAATAGYVRALRPAVDLIRSAVRRGSRALWAEAGERFGQAVFAALRGLGRTQRAPAVLDAVLAVAPPELPRTVRWLRVPDGPRELPWRARSLCCLAYQTPRWRGERCATCPLTPAPDAVDRIAARLRDGG